MFDLIFPIKKGYGKEEVVFCEVFIFIMAALVVGVAFIPPPSARVWFSFLDEDNAVSARLGSAGQTLEGSFSAVSTPQIARVGAFFSIFGDLPN